MPHFIHIDPVLTPLHGVRFLQPVKHTASQNILHITIIIHIILPPRNSSAAASQIAPDPAATPPSRASSDSAPSPSAASDGLRTATKTASDPLRTFSHSSFRSYPRPNRFLRPPSQRSARQNRRDPRPQLPVTPPLRPHRRLHQSPREVRPKPEHQLAVERLRQQIRVVFAQHCAQRGKLPGNGPKRPRERAKGRRTGAVGHPLLVSTWQNPIATTEPGR